MPPDARERILRDDAVELRLVEEGVGTPVVMLHGWALDLEQWAPQAADLARVHRVIRLDRAGFGRSGGAPSVAADVRALELIVDRLALPRVAIVASSQGGRAALRFALAAPQRVAALVLDGVPLEGFRPGPRPEEASPADAPPVSGPESSGSLAAHPFFRLRTEDPRMAALLAAMLTRFASRARGAAAPVPDVELDVAGRLAQVVAPTLIVNGAHESRHRLLVGEALAYGLPQAERVVLPDAGHLANLDQAERYTALLGEFLARHAVPAGGGAAPHL